MSHFILWKWPNMISTWSALWLLMTWGFSTRSSVATVLIKYPRIPSYLWVNIFSTRDVSMDDVSIGLNNNLCQICAKPLFKPIFPYHQLNHQKHLWTNLFSNSKYLHWKKIHLNIRIRFRIHSFSFQLIFLEYFLRNVDYFVQVSMGQIFAYCFPCPGSWLQSAEAL